MTEQEEFLKQVDNALAGEYDRDYWLSRTPQERLQATELMRRKVYGYDENNIPRLQRTFRIIRLDEK